MCSDFDPAESVLAHLDAGTRRELARKWIMAMRDDLASIDASLAAEDHARVGFLAHRMAGSSATVGARTLAGCCRDLETAARNGQPIDRDAVHTVRRHLADAERQLELTTLSGDKYTNREDAPP